MPIQLTKIAAVAVAALSVLGVTGCGGSGGGPSFKAGDCVVIGTDGSLHKVDCQHPPTPDIYLVAQVTAGSCTVASDNEVQDGSDTVCLRQEYVGTAASPQPASSSPVALTYLGPVTIKALRYYCSFQPGSYPPRLIHHNAYGWACAPPGAVVPGQSESISMNQVCNNMYEKAPIMDDVAKYGNYADPYSWRCYEGS
jgi:hypothetical protein